MTNEGQIVPLESGNAHPTYANYRSASHIEAKAAIWIREHNSTGGVVYHNNTGGVCGYCIDHIKTLLPEGAVLRAVSPPNAVAKPGWEVAPEPWVGNASNPKANRMLGR